MTNNVKNDKPNSKKKNKVPDEIEIIWVNI